MSDIQLSDHFTYKRLLQFTWPSILMMIFTSLYSIVDGIMVSNYAGTVSFDALNLIWTFCAILGAFGFMFGTGGSALVAKILGEGDKEKAINVFSLLTYATIIQSVVMGCIGFFFVRDVAIFLGAEGEMVEDCVIYGCILMSFLPAYELQVYSQSLLITAEQPKLAMRITIAAGVTNMVLDYVFIGLWNMGISGAAWASSIGLCVGGFLPLFYFYKIGWLKGCKFSLSAIYKTCKNGLSEFVMNIALSVVGMIYMYQLIREIGEAGVAAYGVMTYFAFIFAAVFLGYGIGTAPIMSYHYGANNKEEMHSLLKKSLKIVVFTGIGMTVLAQLLARPLSSIFVGYDDELLDLTVFAFRFYSLHFIVTGINIYASSFFTSLNNGPVSALISIMRTLVMECGCVLILPMVFGMDAIWWAVVVAETLTMIMSLYLIWKFKPKYGY